VGRNFDSVCPAVLAYDYVEAIGWDGSEEFRSAHRHIWLDSDKHVSGYIRSARNLWQVVMVQAGHMVPQDQPVRALLLISDFIRNLRPTPFSSSVTQSTSPMRFSLLAIILCSIVALALVAVAVVLLLAWRRRRRREQAQRGYDVLTT